MRFDYNELLRQKIYSLQQTLELEGVRFVIDSEQSFIKMKDLEPGVIYVITRDLQNDNSIGVDTQPVQILILSEQNSLEIAKSFFTDFAKKYNFEAISQTYVDSENVRRNIWIKQQYSDPVVLSNFNTMNYGYRSVLYVSTTLYIMYDVVDLKDLKIDNVAYRALTWDLAYNMTPNTQQLSNEYISKSVKSVSSMAITITLPVVESALITKVLAILDESDGASTDLTDTLSYGGNENFYFDFYLGSKHFVNKRMKLVSADIGTAIDNIPAIRLGFIK